MELQLAHAYFFAKNYIIKKGYGMEIDWQNTASIHKISEQDFLQEAAWVVLASGMSDRVVNGVFPHIIDSFYDFKSAEEITRNEKTCKRKALRIFNHSGKIEAIISIAKTVNQRSFFVLKNEIEKEGVEYLMQFPYIGPATAYHLAKNIGLNYAKPDRHLLRMSDCLGFKSPTELCEVIAKCVEEKISTIDLVLWRYATLDRNYLDKIRYMMNKKYYC